MSLAYYSLVRCSINRLDKRKLVVFKIKSEIMSLLRGYRLILYVDIKTILRKHKLFREEIENIKHIVERS